MFVPPASPSRSPLSPRSTRSSASSSALSPSAASAPPAASYTEPSPTSARTSYMLTMLSQGGGGAALALGGGGDGESGSGSSGSTPTSSSASGAAADAAADAAAASASPQPSPAKATPARRGRGGKRSADDAAAAASPDPKKAANGRKRPRGGAKAAAAASAAASASSADDSLPALPAAGGLDQAPLLPAVPVAQLGDEGKEEKKEQSDAAAAAGSESKDDGAETAAVKGSRKKAKDGAYNRKEKSLGLLCENFLRTYAGGSESSICLDASARRLGVERRRIYDIVNILEAVAVVSRRAKNQYAWHGMTLIRQRITRLDAALRDSERETGGQLRAGMEQMVKAMMNWDSKKQQEDSKDSTAASSSNNNNNNSIPSLPSSSSSSSSSPSSSSSSSSPLSAPNADAAPSAWTSEDVIGNLVIHNSAVFESAPSTSEQPSAAAAAAAAPAVSAVSAAASPSPAAVADGSSPSTAAAAAAAPAAPAAAGVKKKGRTFLAASGRDIRKEQSLGHLSAVFVQMFLANDARIVSLEEAARCQRIAHTPQSSDAAAAAAPAAPHLTPLVCSCSPLLRQGTRAAAELQPAGRACGSMRRAKRSLSPPLPLRSLLCDRLLKGAPGGSSADAVADDEAAASDAGEAGEEGREKAEKGKDQEEKAAPAASLSPSSAAAASSAPAGGSVVDASLFPPTAHKLFPLRPTAKTKSKAERDASLFKSKVRRLYDIANVFASLKLIDKIHLIQSRRPAFRWLGADLFPLDSTVPPDAYTRETTGAAGAISKRKSSAVKAEAAEAGGGGGGTGGKRVKKEEHSAHASSSSSSGGEEASLPNAPGGPSQTLHSAFLGAGNSRPLSFSFGSSSASSLSSSSSSALLAAGQSASSSPSSSFPPSSSALSSAAGSSSLPTAMSALADGKYWFYNHPHSFCMDRTQISTFEPLDFAYLPYLRPDNADIAAAAAHAVAAAQSNPQQQQQLQRQQQRADSAASSSSSSSPCVPPHVAVHSPAVQAAYIADTGGFLDGYSACCRQWMRSIPDLDAAQQIGSAAAPGLVMVRANAALQPAAASAEPEPAAASAGTGGGGLAAGRPRRTRRSSKMAAS